MVRFDLVVTCGGTGIRYAVVGYSADLVRSTSGTTLSFLGAGRYNIRFASPVTGCAFIATWLIRATRSCSTRPACTPAAVPDANTVYIETKNPGGGLQDGVPFHLELICSSTANTRYAVVQATGAKQRSSSGMTATRLRSGNFQISSNNLGISACATVATRGSAEYWPYPSTRGPSKSCRARPTTRSTSRSVSCCSSAGALNSLAFHAASVC